MRQDALIIRLNQYVWQFCDWELPWPTEANNFDDPPILKEVVSHAMKHIKKGKTTRLDEIMVEKFVVLLNCHIIFTAVDTYLMIY